LNISTYVVLKNKIYYIFRDNYPWKAPVLEAAGTKDNYSVLIDAMTGELTPPQWFAAQ